MKYFKATYTNGYCGCDIEEYYEAETDIEAEQMAWDDVERYPFYEPDGRFIDPDDYDTEDDYLEAIEDYQTNNVCIEIEEVTKKEYEENVEE